MTGTAETESSEFQQIYKLEVVVIPTHRDVVRQDENDLIYRTEKEKIKAIANDVKQRYEKGQPVLIGTISIEKSEMVGKALSKINVPHDILNAKQHEREASIIEYAGKKGKVTIATNMAGRGVDIKITPEVKELGGLYVLGTERHESRRIDNQLRGRAGRQGDPGGSQFYLSLEDDLMRVFGSGRIGSVMSRMGLKEDEVITHPLINRSIAGAQKRVEAQNFEMRKHLLQYDDVMNRQRQVIYSIRKKILKGDKLEGEIKIKIQEAVEIILSDFASQARVEDWDFNKVNQLLKKSFGFSVSFEGLKNKSSSECIDVIMDKVFSEYQTIKADLGEPFNDIERQLFLMVIDNFWKENLYSMDNLKEAIRFRGYAQKDPLQEYKREGFSLFESTLDNISLAFTERIMHIKENITIQRVNPNQSVNEKVSEDLKEALPAGSKIGRNDSCYCGSGKKYKKCCGKNG